MFQYLADGWYFNPACEIRQWEFLILRANLPHYRITQGDRNPLPGRNPTEPLGSLADFGLRGLCLKLRYNKKAGILIWPL
jgi:hypothetical protein